ncbi:MAG: hypothetical protein IJU50_07410 [Lachnospiraceae bacterium]|nr:hypothetical protein [Lachnospiraceae bacterium]
MNKRTTIIYLSILVLFLLLPLPVGAAFGNRLFGGMSENRVLSAFPEVSAKLSAIRAFPAGFEAYFGDHLPLKTPLVFLNGLLDYHVFKSSPSDSVIVGQKGYLFYRGSQLNEEDPYKDYYGLNLFTEEELMLIRDNLKEAEAYLESKGCRFILFLPPNKERPYADKMPASFGSPWQECRLNQLREYLTENTEITVVAPLEDIEAYHQTHLEEELYYRFDTHWNRLGAYLAAGALGKELGFSLPSLETLKRNEIEPFSGDLASQMGLYGYLKDEPVWVPEGFSSVNPSYVSFGEGFQGEASGEGVLDQSLLLAGDSFSALLYPYLGYFYARSLSVNYYDYEDGLLEASQPDVFVLEVVERYLANLETFSIHTGIERRLE